MPNPAIKENVNVWKMGNWKHFGASDVKLYIEELLKRFPKFTGKLEINFRDGIIRDINETRRTKF